MERQTGMVGRRWIPECSLDPHLEKVRLDPKSRLVRVVLELLTIAGEHRREIGQLLAAHDLRVVLVSKVVGVLERGQVGGAQRDRAWLLKQKLGLPKHGRRWRRRRWRRWRRRGGFLRCDRGTKRGQLSEDGAVLDLAPLARPSMLVFKIEAGVGARRQFAIRDGDR
eukprot:1531982-Prymnesium_polylepis.1